MSRHGIPVDGEAAAQIYSDMLTLMKQLAEEITKGADLNLWNASHIYALLKDQHSKSLSRSVHRIQEVSHAELKYMAASIPAAARILEWRDLQTDLNFLKAAAGQSRIHPRWNLITKTSRITASNPQCTERQ